MRSKCNDGSPVRTPVTASSSNFDLLECSDVIADVISEVYKTEREAYRPLDNLLLVRWVTGRWMSVRGQLYWVRSRVSNHANTARASPVAPYS